MELRLASQRKQNRFLNESLTRRDKLRGPAKTETTPIIVIQKEDTARDKFLQGERTTSREREPRQTIVEEREKRTDREAEKREERREQETVKWGEERKEKREDRKEKEVWSEKREVEKKEVREPLKKKAVNTTATKEDINPKMTKVAFADSSEDLKFSERLNYLPHVVVMLTLLSGTVFILGSVGSSQWMQAEVNGVTVYYGLFERCFVNLKTNITTCDDFDWPGWLAETGEEKMSGIKVMAIFSIFFASVFLLGSLALSITYYCKRSRGWCRHASIVVVDICLWLMVSSAGVSSLLFLTGLDNLEAYPHSRLLFPPVMYCAGWILALVSRLIIAACCDIYSNKGVSMPFV